MEKIGKIFARNLKELRAGRHQVDVATDIGVSVRAWQRMEKGGRLPKSPDTITAIASYFRVPESRLFQDNALPKPSVNADPHEALAVLAKLINQPPAAIPFPQPQIDIPTEDAELVKGFIRAIRSDKRAREIIEAIVDAQLEDIDKLDEKRAKDRA